MRTISAALLTAQKAATGLPLVDVVATNYTRDVRHYTPTVLYAGAGEADVPHDARADATYLHRIRVLANNNLEYQRVALASPSFSTWTLLDTGVTAAAISIVGARVIVAYSKGSAILHRESTDNGGSFAAAFTVLATIATPQAVAVAYKNSSGDLAIFWEDSNNFGRIRRTSGTFGSATAWPFTANQINSCSAIYTIDYELTLSGKDSANRPTIWGLILGDGGTTAVDTWAKFNIANQAEADESVTMHAAHIDRPDSYRITWVEKFTGTPNRTRCLFSLIPSIDFFSAGPWRFANPTPLDDITNNGLAICSNTTHLFYSRPARVLQDTHALVTTSLTKHLLEAVIHEHNGLNQSAVLTFDNSQGQFAGPPAYIALHRDIRLRAGYAIEQTDPTYPINATTPLPLHFITGWEYDRAGSRSVFRLHTEGLNLWLARYSPNTTITRTATLASIVRTVSARANLTFIDSGSSSQAANVLTWTIHAHQSLLATLLAILETLPDVIIPFYAGLEIREVLSSQAADYTFGTDHDIYHHSTRKADQDALAIVHGENAVGEALDLTITDHDTPLTTRVRDPHANTAAIADGHATARLRKAVLNASLGELVVPPCLGLQIADVITHTDPLVSTTPLKSRVRAIHLHYRRAGHPQRGPNLYQQRIELGGV